MASKAVVTLGDGALDGRVERHGVCQQRGDGPRQVRHGAVGARRRAVVQVLAHAGRAAAHQGPATSLLLGTTQSRVAVASHLLIKRLVELNAWGDKSNNGFML